MGLAAGASPGSPGALKLWCHQIGQPHPPMPGPPIPGPWCQPVLLVRWQVSRSPMVLAWLMQRSRCSKRAWSCWVICRINWRCSWKPLVSACTGHVSSGNARLAKQRAMAWRWRMVVGGRRSPFGIGPLLSVAVAHGASAASTRRPCAGCGPAPWLPPTRARSRRQADGGFNLGDRCG
jgi:hypothetical protein